MLEVIELENLPKPETVVEAIDYSDKSGTKWEMIRTENDSYLVFRGDPSRKPDFMKYSVKKNHDKINLNKINTGLCLVTG